MKISIGWVSATAMRIELFMRREGCCYDELLALMAGVWGFDGDVGGDAVARCEHCKGMC